MSLSIEKTNLLIQYLKENQDVFEVVFFGISCETFAVEPRLYFQNYHELIFQTHWLFENKCDNIKPVGILGESIVFMENDGVMVEYCKGLQNLPYVLFGIKTLNRDEWKIDKYNAFVVNKYSAPYSFFLNKYETWCKEVGIEINPKMGLGYAEEGMGVSREINPYYIPEDNLIFDESESAKDISVKTLTALEIAK